MTFDFVDATLREFRFLIDDYRFTVASRGDHHVAYNGREVSVTVTMHWQERSSDVQLENSGEKYTLFEILSAQGVVWADAVPRHQGPNPEEAELFHLAQALNTHGSRALNADHELFQSIREFRRKQTARYR